MARNCNCAGQTCGCLVTGGVGIVVEGQGTASNPFVVTNVASDLSAALEIQDTTTVDLILQGGGTNLDPFILSANATLKLQQLSDVNNPGGNPTNGQVPVYVGVSGAGGHWEFAAAPTGGGSTAPPETFAFSKAGTISVSTGTARLYNDSGVTRTVKAMRLSFGIAPAGSAATFQVKKNGTNFGSAVSVAAGSNTQLTSGLTLSWLAGEYLTIDVAAVGSTTAGSDATFTLLAS
jgi:hypothetical protein